MIRRATPAVLAAFLLLAPSVSRADLANYSQDFESLVQTNPAALNADGWLVFGNVFSPDHSAYYYGYGPFPAPNGGAAFCGIDLGQGGPGQGAQQLVVYNDYNSGEHPSGNLVEANVFQQQTIGAADVGSTWIFRFDAKRGNIVPPTQALAFIKTLDPNNGYATTSFITTDMTDELPQAVKDAVIAKIPLGSFGNTGDIASAVAFLASAEARYITGQVLAVDGGMTM